VGSGDVRSLQEFNPLIDQLCDESVNHAIDVHNLQLQCQDNIILTLFCRAGSVVQVQCTPCSTL